MASEPPVPAIVTRVSRGAVDRAVTSLLKWLGSHRHDDDESIFLVLTLKKIPHRGRSTAESFCIPLPHPVAASACLVVDDSPKSASVSSSAARDLVRGLELPVPVDVLSLSELRNDRGALANSHDIFVSDRRLAPLVLSLLGQKKKRNGDKVPVQINLCHTKWPEYLHKACTSSPFRLGSGTCSVVKVGRMWQRKEAIVENVVAAAEGVVKFAPKKWKNVRALHLKTSESSALPVYEANDNLKSKVETSGNEELHAAKRRL